MSYSEGERQDLENFSKNWYTPLHKAIVEGDLSEISSLLKEGTVNINARTKSGLTPLALSMGWREKPFEKPYFTPNAMNLAAMRILLRSSAKIKIDFSEARKLCKIAYREDLPEAKKVIKGYLWSRKGSICLYIGIFCFFCRLLDGPRRKKKLRKKIANEVELDMLREERKRAESLAPTGEASQSNNAEVSQENTSHQAQ